MKILFLEPFYGGSHKEFALGFQAHSCHEISILGLPARFWKWRMRGAALYFANQIKNIAEYDVIFATDMLDLTDFKAFAGKDIPPVVMYFHENQLSYPLPEDQTRDFHLGFTNIICAAAADKVLFNSQFQFNAFIREAQKLIKIMPDHRPGWMIDLIKNKAQIIYPGCRFETGKPDIGKQDFTPPLIVWNHRWEFDKQPELFFNVLKRIKDKNIDFSLAVLGEHSEQYPEIFDRAQKVFKDQIRVFGFVDSHEHYLCWLEKGTVVVSCAIQENFGISVVEAVRKGCLPLLPDRLSYPEIIPEQFHSQVIYGSEEELMKKLEKVLLNPQGYREIRERLSLQMEKFAWENQVRKFDQILEEVKICHL
ncbi:MAG: DUF3524 domain-containing protein [Proteobacteria bacterium]|nr:DUF3524 domain-containing protein [Pseudomonadota bacterium]MBU1388578.1 DUF3524 domain-containing protein [Pseudomonadota bacterium]MBU1541734.1 DUF3524 domain-containing protein [Pseudomonadota bacterium]MBU2431565.1 DUF3524 domain-containing protein [Pseudomonadota bacterium]